MRVPRGHVERPAAAAARPRPAEPARERPGDLYAEVTDHGAQRSCRPRSGACSRSSPRRPPSTRGGRVNPQATMTPSDRDVCTRPASAPRPRIVRPGHRPPPRPGPPAGGARAARRRHATRPGGCGSPRRSCAAMARVQRLRAGFGLNYAALGLVIDLLDRIAALEAAARASLPTHRRLARGPEPADPEVAGGAARRADQGAALRAHRGRRRAPAAGPARPARRPRARGCSRRPAPTPTGCAPTWRPSWPAARGSAGPGAAPGQVFVTQRLSRLLDAAEREAKRLKDEYVSVEHLRHRAARRGRGHRRRAGCCTSTGVTRDAFLAGADQRSAATSG